MTPEEKREKYSGVKVTLDGQAAEIIGYRHKFAAVATLPTGAAYQWTWDAVELVVSKGGDFRS